MALVAPEKRSRTGRRPKVDSARFERLVFELMDYHGEFVSEDPEWDGPARLENRLADKFGVHPSTIRRRLKAPLEKWRRAKQPG